MRRSVLALGASIIALGCAGDDGAAKVSAQRENPDAAVDAGDECPPTKLAAHCKSEDCTRSMEDAVSEICTIYKDAALISRNECGGQSVSSMGNLSGVSYHFDAAGKLLGIGNWSDALPPPGECGKPQVGRECAIREAGERRACPQP